MPKIGHGIFITCEKTIKMFIKNLNNQNGNKIILEELDDTHIIIDEKYLGIVQDEVYKMQDKNSFNPIQVNNP